NSRTETLPVRAALGQCLNYSRDGRLLAVAGSDQQVHIHDAGTGRWLSSISARCGRLTCVAFARNHSLVCAGWGGVARVWSLQTGQELHALVGHNGALRGVAFDSRDDWMATVGHDRTVRLWPYGRPPAVRDWNLGRQTVLGVGFDLSGDQIVSVADDGVVR